MYLILANRTEADMSKTRSMLEVPDPGYTGSLKGTSWDPDLLLEGYRQ